MIQQWHSISPAAPRCMAVPLLVMALKRRFAPIRLTTFQAQLFHNQQQQENETVDQFAQDLQKLYNLAYAGATSKGPQAERMGQTLLVNQFITGLQSDLKQKLIGTEESLEELILKPRFEEAKTPKLVGDRPMANAPNQTPRPSGEPSPTPASNFVDTCLYNHLAGSSIQWNTKWSQDKVFQLRPGRTYCQELPVCQEE